MGPDRAPQAFSWRDDLRAHLSLHGTDLSAAQWSLLDLYLERILRHNRRVNLTAASTPQEVALRHFADAFAALPVLRRRLEGAARGGASAASPPPVPQGGAAQDGQKAAAAMGDIERRSPAVGGAAATQA